jgi:hypothetical protein
MSSGVHSWAFAARRIRNGFVVLSLKATTATPNIRIKIPPQESSTGIPRTLGVRGKNLGEYDFYDKVTDEYKFTHPEE